MGHLPTFSCLEPSGRSTTLKRLWSSSESARAFAVSSVTSTGGHALAHPSTQVGTPSASLVNPYNVWPPASTRIVPSGASLVVTSGAGAASPVSVDSGAGAVVVGAAADGAAASAPSTAAVLSTTNHTPPLPCPVMSPGLASPE